jgi:hypothetical protein
MGAGTNELAAGVEVVSGAGEEEDSSLLEEEASVEPNLRVGRTEASSDATPLVVGLAEEDADSVEEEEGGPKLEMIWASRASIHTM